MVTWLIVVVLGGLIVWKVLSGFDGMLKFLSICFFVVLGFGVAQTVGDQMPKEAVVVTSQSLHNLYEDSRISGGIFVGVSQDDMIHYNVNTPYGPTPKEMPKYDNNVYFPEDGSDNPRLEYVVDQFVSPTSWLWGIASPNSKNIFHIPPGSVDNNFKVK